MAEDIRNPDAKPGDGGYWAGKIAQDKAAAAAAGQGVIYGEFLPPPAEESTPYSSFLPSSSPGR